VRRNHLSLDGVEKRANRDKERLNGVSIFKLQISEKKLTFLGDSFFRFIEMKIPKTASFLLNEI